VNDLAPVPSVTHSNVSGGIDKPERKPSGNIILSNERRTLKCSRPEAHPRSKRSAIYWRGSRVADAKTTTVVGHSRRDTVSIEGLQHDWRDAQTLGSVSGQVSPRISTQLAAETARVEYKVRVRAIVLEAEGIASFELQDPLGRPLPPFTAGSHIDIHIKPGCIRQYSLCNDPAERHRYLVAAQREDKGGGGSRALHEDTRIGDIVTISGPRNHFPLVESARRHLLIAGGIGVTPIMAMIADLEARGHQYQLYYCTRTPERTAFLARLAPLRAAGKVVIHHDEGDPSRGLDLSALLQNAEPGTHVYYCGPPGFMKVAAIASAHWPKDSVHCEYFTPRSDAISSGSSNRSFQVKLVRSGMTLEVPADKSIVDVLREHNVFIETSCESGVCGTCLTRYVDGVPEHRDSVLDESDRNEFVLVCCARSKTPVLTLDL